jgi:hypothetical protein
MLRYEKFKDGLREHLAATGLNPAVFGKSLKAFKQKLRKRMMDDTPIRYLTGATLGEGSGIQATNQRCPHV